MSHTAELIAIGTELLLGNIANTDAQMISEGLSELGINVFYHTVVGDNPERVRQAVDIARTRADIIITTGGLGPTCDDLTKVALAEAFGKGLFFHEPSAQRIRDRFLQMERPMTENNLQQAMLPEGCTVLENDWGTAPGVAFEADGVHVLMLPGPPRECLSMFKNCAVPYLSALSDSQIHSHNIHIFGMGESSVEDKLRDMMLSMENPTIAPYAKDGECRLRVTAKAKSAEEAEKLMAPVIEKIRAVLGDVIYSIDIDSLEATVLGLLKECGKTFACTESCTGGMVAKRMTDVSGASAVFLGGAVTYCNSVKTELAGVPKELLDEKTAVCPEVAALMAKGIRERLGADYAVGITGIAGPLSDESGAEVGLVYVSLSCADGEFVRTLHLGSDRTRIRTAASNHAFDLVRRSLTGLPLNADSITV